MWGENEQTWIVNCEVVNLGRVGEVVNNSIQERLDTFVFKSGAKKHRGKLASDGGATNSSLKSQNRLVSMEMS